MLVLRKFFAYVFATRNTSQQTLVRCGDLPVQEEPAFVPDVRREPDWKTRLLWMRRPVQIAALLVFVGLPWLNGLGYGAIQGSLFFFECFGVPFAEPLSVVQTLLSGVFPGWKRGIGALLVLLITLCLGRVFCSWCCPFGVLSEGVHGVRRWVSRSLIRCGLIRCDLIRCDLIRRGWSRFSSPEARSDFDAAQRLSDARTQGRLPRSGFRSRLLLTGAGLVLVALLGVAFLNPLFVPETVLEVLRTALREVFGVGTAPENTPFAGLRDWVSFLPLAGVLLVLFGEGVSGKRFWCRWICPQSVPLSLLARLPLGVRLERDPKRCLCPSDERACRAACSLDLDPRLRLSPLECTHCGACVLACSRVHAGKPAALSLKALPLLSRPAPEQGSSACGRVPAVPPSRGHGSRGSHGSHGSHGSRGNGLLLILCVALIGVMGVSVILPVLPLLALTFDLSAPEVGLLITCFTLPSAFMTPVAGVLADRFGRKAILLPGLLLFALGGVGCALSQTFVELLLFRAVQGLGAAPLGILYGTLVGDFYEEADRPGVMGMVGATISIGTALYPAAGGLLGEVHWSYPFWLSLLALPVGVLALRVPFARSGRRMDWKQYASDSRSLLLNPAVIGLFGLTFLCFCILYGPTITYVPLLADVLFKASPALIGGVFMISSLGTALIAMNLSRLGQRYTARRLMLSAAGCYCLAQSLMLLLPPFSSTALVLILPIFFGGVAQGLTFPILTARMTSVASSANRGIVMAMNGTVLRLSQSASPLVFGLGWTVLGWPGPYVMGLCVSVGIGLLVLRIFPLTSDTR